MNEVIKVTFGNDEFTSYVSGLTQWNYGASLEVAGLNIPDGSIEVHFSLKEMTGDAIRYIGTVKNGILTCDIPSFITLCDTVYDYNGYAFIYLTDADSGITIKKVVFNIMARPKPEDFIPPEEPGIVGQLLEMIDNKVDKVEGKELSSNDYTDEDKNKLAALPTNAELTANIDGVKSDLQKEIKDTADNLSANVQGMFAEQDEEIEKDISAVYGKIDEVNSELNEKIERLEMDTDANITASADALRREIGDLNDAANDKFANAVKGYASGEIVRVDDVSPIEHTAKAVIKGKNLIEYPYNEKRTEINGVTITDENGVLTFNGTATANSGYIIYRESNVPVDGVYTLSGLSNGSATTIYIQPYIDDVAQSTVVTKPVTYEWHGKITQMIIFFKNGTTFENLVISPMLEKGDTATEYEPYINPETIKVTRYGTDEADNPETYTPDASGLVEMKSLSPTMTIITDTAGVNIDLEYNQDTNKAFDYVKEDITTLDNDMAVLKGNMGDVETALDNIIEIQNSLIGGDA